MTGFPSARNQAPYLTGAQIASNQDIARPQGLNIRGDNEPVTMLQRNAYGNYAGLANNTAFRTGLQPDYQRSIMEILERFKNRNYAMQGQRATNQVTGLGAQAQRQADLRARASGLGQGAQLGAMQGLNSQITRQAAAAQEHWNDPHLRDQDLIQRLGVLQNAMQFDPYFEQILAAVGPSQQRASAYEAGRGGRGFGSVVGAVAPFIPMVPGLQQQPSGFGQGYQGGTDYGMRPGSQAIRGMGY